jgi:hypothetical protein
VCTAYVHLSPSTSVARASADFPTSISNPFSPEHTGLRPPLKTPCTQVEVTLPPWLFLVQKPGNPAGTNRLEHRSKWKKTLAEGLVWGQSGSPKAPKALGVPDGALREMSEVCKSQEATGLTSVTRAPGIPSFPVSPNPVVRPRSSSLSSWTPMAKGCQSCALCCHPLSVVGTSNSLNPFRGGTPDKKPSPFTGKRKEVTSHAVTVQLPSSLCTFGHCPSSTCVSMPSCLLPCEPYATHLGSSTLPSLSDKGTLISFSAALLWVFDVPKAMYVSKVCHRGASTGSRWNLVGSHEVIESPQGNCGTLAMSSFSWFLAHEGSDFVLFFQRQLPLKSHPSPQQQGQ